MTVEPNRPLLDHFAHQFTPEPWITQANCNGVSADRGDHDLFFSPRGATQLAAIHKFCEGCPVAWECLEYSVRLEMGHGIWGAMPPDDRHRLLKRHHWQIDSARFRQDWETARSRLAIRAERLVDTPRSRRRRKST